jgi:hypothetical protein
MTQKYLACAPAAPFSGRNAFRVDRRAKSAARAQVHEVV